MSWIRSPRANPSATHRFIVFHHAGGMGNAYFQWHLGLPPEVELFIVDLPGRGMLVKEKRIERFDVLIKKLIQELSPYLDRPFILFGHSLGALLTYELAKQLPAAAQDNLRRIVLSAFKPPTEKNLSEHPVLSHLPDDAFLKKMNEIAPLPKEITQHAETLAYFISLIRSDLKIIESYQLKNLVIPGAKAMILGGDSDPQIPSSSLEAWKQLVSVQGEVRVFPGNHFFIFQNASAVLSEIFKTFL